MMNKFDRTLTQGTCLDCPALCCSQNLINVCGYDAWLIATGLSVEPTSFLAFARGHKDKRDPGAPKTCCPPRGRVWCPNR